MPNSLIEKDALLDKLLCSDLEIGEVDREVLHSHNLKTSCHHRV